MPRISYFYGISIYMYYGDHAPPHLRAIYGEHEATVAVETVEILQGRLPPRARSFVLEWASLECTERSFSGTGSVPEPPNPSNRLLRWSSRSPSFDSSHHQGCRLRSTFPSPHV